MSFYTNAFQRNGKIFVRGYDDDLEPFSKIVNDYKPYIFIPDQNANGDYKTIDGTHVTKKTFPNLRTIYEFLKQYKDVENAEYYGLTNFVYTYLNDTFPGKIKFHAEAISVVSLDIEVSSKNGFPDINKAEDEITAITLVKRGKSISFGVKDFIPTNPRSEYVQCDSEADMLRQFLSTWGSDNWIPDVVTGWSADMFDIPYIVHRITNLLGEAAAKRLSPFGFIEQREIIRSKGSNFKNFNDRKEVVYELYGITILDYLQLYKKFTFTNHESYSLNNIAKYELGKEKLKYDGSLDELYENDPQRYFEYNIEDAFLIDEMEDKKNFIKFVTSLAYEAKINYIDGMVTLRPWDVIIHNYLLERGIVIPQYKHKLARPILGGYVKNSQIGLHKWVVSFDFESLYPSIISQHNISPETYVGKQTSSDPEHIVNRELWPELAVPNYVYCANGTRYRKDIRGFIPDIIDVYKQKRKDIKDEMQRLKKAGGDKKIISILDSQQQAVKILNNGLYGALSMEYFRWYDADLAEAVTTTSQCCTRYIEKKLNEFFNRTLQTVGVDYVIAADTDSVYITLEPLLNAIGDIGRTPEQTVELIDQMMINKFSPLIAKWCQEVCDKFNVYKPLLNMKREAIAEKGIWRAPKMYVMNVWDMEGVRYKTPELKVKGMEIVRSSTPMICRSRIKEAVSIVMNKNEKELQDYVEAFRSEYNRLPFEVIANPRTVDGIDKYSDPVTLCAKATPFHVRGAIVYNHAIHTLGLEKKYKPIRDKDKIRFVYLKEPNPFNTHVIAAPDELPSEFELEQYIDRQQQFEKTFLSPIQSITNLIGWRTTPINDLKAFL